MIHAIPPTPPTLAAALLQLPTLNPGAIETWLLSAMAVASLVVMGRKLFVRKPPIEAEFVSKSDFRQFEQTARRELDALRDRIDSRFLSLGEKIEHLRADLAEAGEKRSRGFHERISQVESGLARVDERTRK